MLCQEGSIEREVARVKSATNEMRHSIILIFDVLYFNFSTPLSKFAPLGGASAKVTKVVSSIMRLSSIDQEIEVEISFLPPPSSVPGTCS